MDRTTCALLAFAVLGALAAMALIALDASGDLPPVWDPLPSFAAVEDEPVTVDLSPYVGDPDTPLDELWLECSDPGANVSRFCITTVIHVGGIGILAVYLNDGNSTASETLVFVVEDVNDPPRLKVVLLPDAYIDEDYEFFFTATDEDDAPSELMYTDDTPVFDILGDGRIMFRPDNADLGYHALNITVRDPHGANDTAPFSLFISCDVIAPPFPYIEPLTAYVGQPFVLDLDCPEPPLYLPPEWWPNYTWSIDSPRFVINQTEGLFTWDCPMGPDVGDNYFKITLQDERGRYCEQEVKVTVCDPVPPVAEAGPDITIDQGEAFTLDARCSSDDCGLVRWTFTCVHELLKLSLEGAVVVLTLPTAGDYGFALEVEDWGGNVANDTVTVHVRDSEPPVAVARACEPILMHGRAYLDGSDSHDDVGIVTYRWTLFENSSIQELYGPAVRVVLDTAGRHKVRLEVIDAAGLASTAELEVVVLDNERPTADAGKDLIAHVGQLNCLDGSASTDNVGIVSYEWDVIGPGAPRHFEGARVSVSLDRPGTYSVRLSATDAAGNRGTDETVLKVVAEEPAHSASIHEAITPVLLVGLLTAIVLLRRWTVR